MTSVMFAGVIVFLYIEKVYLYKEFYGNLYAFLKKK